MRRWQSLLGDAVLMFRKMFLNRWNVPNGLSDSPINPPTRSLFFEQSTLFKQSTHPAVCGSPNLLSAQFAESLVPIVTHLC